jgi:signal transduction histidine kinase
MNAAAIAVPRAEAVAFRDSGRPISGSWMRGITFERLGLVGLAVLIGGVANSSFPDARSWQHYVQQRLDLTGLHFVSLLPMFILVVKTEIWTANSATRVRIAALALAVAAGAVLYAACRWGIRLGVPPRLGVAASYWEYSLGHVFRGLVLGGLFTAILFFVAREREAQRRLHQTRLARVEIDRQMTEARLQLLQAQIEPHFLFNSLASVKRLYEREPGEGRALLGNLREYLRVAIPSARVRETRFAEEVALARSFLAIFRVRMGRRLTIRIDVPADLEAAMIPPLMIGTLIENAIKHGIGPRASGGTVSIVARKDGELLEVAVTDDGVGFRARSGHGTGLANIRARLQTLFGGQGTLDLEARAEGGVTATIRLPYRIAAQDTGSP